MHKYDVIDLRTYRGADLEEDASEDPASQYLRAGTMLLLGQYTITGYLNCGGFGITYKAKDSLGRDVVLKECFPSALCYRSGNAMSVRTPAYQEELDSIVGQFIKEAKRLANLQHENIVHVHQIFEENDTAYIAMDFIDGPDLLDILEEDSMHFTPSDIQFLTEKLLHAIKYVHDHGMLHRDISPDNILIDRQGEPVLIDFGSAREHATTSGRALSRLKFVKDGYSPQEFYIAGSAQGTWSDLYSFAASIYHMITGIAPEDAQKRLAAIAAKENDPYVPLLGSASGYPSQFLAAIDKALQIIPDQRLQTADAWLAHLLARPGALIGAATLFDAKAKLLGVANGFGLGARQGVALASAVGVAAVGIALALVLGPSANNSNLSSPFETLAGVGPLQAAEASAIASERVEFFAPGKIETAPLGLGALLPVAMDNADVVHSPEPESQRVADIGALPVQAIELVSLAPVMAPVSALSVTGLTKPETGTVNIDIGVNTAVLLVPDPATLFVPSDETLPQVTLHSAKPSISSDVADTAFASARIDVLAMSISPESALAELPDLRVLPTVTSDVLVVFDVTPPPYMKKNGPLAETQVAYSHWDVVMPFEAVSERVRNSHTIKISTITDASALAMSGDWIKEGVVIYSFNGETLAPQTPLSAHVLSALQIDPDGYARATVRYRDPDSGLIDRGLLAVPVVRQIGLADGSVFEARVRDLSWEIVVISASDMDGSLRAGDVLTSELTTGVVFGTHEDLTRTLAMLVEREIVTAEFAVLRDGREMQAEWDLSWAN